MEGRFGQMYRFKLKFGRNAPNIVFDGIVNPNASGIKVLCIRDNTNQTFAALDAENGFRNISRDISPYDCTIAPFKTNKE